MKISLIAALGPNREIGLNNKLPWNIPEEHDHYLNTVKNSHVIIGRKNYEAHDKKLTDVISLVLTRNKNYICENAIIFNDHKKLLVYALKLKLPEIFVLGGAEIYKLFLPYASDFYLSKVAYSGSADSFFPEYSHYRWNLKEEKKFKNYHFSHLTKIPNSIKF